MKRTAIIRNRNLAMNLNKIILVFTIVTSLSIVFLTGCTENGNNEAKGEKTYYCPMHPEVVSDKPGVCPICHMDLVLKDNQGNDLSEHMDQGLDLNESKLLTANVSTVPVKSGNISQTITAYSYLDFTEQSRKSITARFNGRIENLLVDRTGEYVKQGQPLFEVYSPDLIQAQNDYLLSLNYGGNSGYLQDNKNVKEISGAARQKLMIMGITADQISELEKSKQVKMTITYYSPYSGVIIDKKVQEGMYVNEGALLYEAADMSVLWNIAEVYESDLGGLKKGAPMKLTLDAYPGKIFEGKIDFIYPVVNSQSRTVKVRSVILAKGDQLKPNMFGQAVFNIKNKTGLIVPEQAVLFTGNKNIVWVMKEPGRFEKREIKIGVKGENGYEVLSGLKEGEFVASSGGFLIDSESQLRSGNSSGDIHQGTEHEEIKQPENKPVEKTNKQSSLSDAATWNTVCPVIGGKVDPEVKTVVYKDRTIGFCCPGCDEDFKKDPEGYLKNLNESGTKYISLNQE